MAARATHSRTRLANAPRCYLLDLADELIVSVCENLEFTDDAVCLSATCEKLHALVSNSTHLWVNMIFSKAGAGRLTDVQLSALLQRVNARTCTTLLRLQYSEISGVGLLPLVGSTCLQVLDLRQTHGPCAHYPDEGKHWDCQALLQLLESLTLSNLANGRAKHVFLSFDMAPDSVGHPRVNLLGDDEVRNHIFNVVLDLRTMGSPPPKYSGSQLLMLPGAMEAIDGPLKCIECSVCQGAAGGAARGVCELLTFCNGCSLSICSSCEAYRLEKKCCCANDDCRNFLCEVCEDCSLATCAMCDDEFCDACGQDGDEMPDGEFCCYACVDDFSEDEDY